MRAPRPRHAGATAGSAARPDAREKWRPCGDSRSYVQKLIAALRGPLPDRRLLAARLLGRLRSRAAVAVLTAIAREPDDPYLRAEAARALALIDPELPVVAELVRDGPLLVRSAVRSTIRRRPGVRAGRSPSPRKEDPRDR